MKLINIVGNLYKLIIPGESTVYFSYETPVAINNYNGANLVAKNEWSKTTGKHLNVIKKELPSYEEVIHEELVGYLDGLFATNE